MIKVFLVLSVVLITDSILTSYGNGSTVESIAKTKKKSFNEVTIGTQIWMDQSLNVDKFRNGEVIPEAKTEQEWKAFSDSGKAAWCYYANDKNFGYKYGKLYNWFAVNDSRGLAPKGWHVPSDKEWKVLFDFLGGNDIAGKKMKGLESWMAEGNGTNESGFNGLPARFREYNGDFFGLIEPCFGYWWCDLEYDKNQAWYVFLHSYGDDVGMVNDMDKGAGLSVRCIRD